MPPDKLKPITTVIPVSLNKAIDAHCTATGRKKKAFIAEACAEKLEREAGRVG